MKRPGNRTIYVADVAVWNRARRFCAARNVSLSRLIMDALTFYLDRLTSL